MAGNSQRRGGPGAGHRQQEGRGGRLRRGPPARPGGPRPDAAGRGAARGTRPSAARGRRGARTRPASRPAPAARRPSCWSAATRWWRRCARTSRPPRSTWRRASRSTSGSPRSSAPAADRGMPVLEVSRAELDRMTGGVLHQGIGLQVPPFAYEPFDDLLAARAGAPDRAAAGGARRGDRPAQPGRGDPVGGRVRRARRVRARAAGRRHDRDRLAHQRRRGRPAAGRPGDQPDPGAQGGASRPGFVVVGLDADGDVRCTTWRRRSARWWWWSAPRAAACPGWSARPATCG